MKVLIVEDDAAARGALEEITRGLGDEPRSAGTLARAREILEDFSPDVCLTDLRLPDGDGLSFVREAHQADSKREIVVLTGHGSVDSAVEAMKAGAVDYLVKPLHAEQIEAVLNRLREGHELIKEVEDVTSTLEATGRFGAMVGRSGVMLETCRVISRIARSEAPVMITGESGSGKERAAETIHALSRRRGHPLVAINCGAVSPNLIESELFGHEKGAFTGADKRRIGYFELARGGSLFLDEVTEMSPELQVKFLRVLETKAFRRVGGNEEIGSDVRILASSNRNLEEPGAERKLREDLYYRLNVLPLCIAPLRERKEDIPLLARHFLAQIVESEGGGLREFSDAALAVLAEHDWPGNVREFRNAVYRSYVLSDGATIDAPAVHSVLRRAPPEKPPARTPPPADLSAPPGPLHGNATAAPANPTILEIHIGESLDDVERLLLERTLAFVGGDKTKAAAILKISRKTIYNRIRKYGLNP